MKTFKAMMIGLALLVVCGLANASAKKSNNGPTKDDVVNAYLNAVVHGKLGDVESAIDDDAQFNMVRGDKVITLSKSQELNFLKSNESLEQDCKCAPSVMQDDGDVFIKKVEMKFADFTRTDVISAQRVGYGWKITKVETSYK
jgi:hypothetical protein